MVHTAANLCKRVPKNCFLMVVDTLPTLTNFLTYDDCKLVENAVLCFSRSPRRASPRALSGRRRGRSWADGGAVCAAVAREGAHRALCPRCAKRRLFSTAGSHGSQGPELCTPDAVLTGSCTLL